MPEQLGNLGQLAWRIDLQNKNRALWEIHDTPQRLEEMFNAEAQEMRECEDNFFLKPNADFEMVSEVGDVGYLFLRYMKAFGDPPEAMSRQLTEAINISARCNFTMTQAVEMKLIRNAVKYPDSFFDATQDFDQGVRDSRSLWKALGDDEAFFSWYSQQ